jgi:hypothetical protein
MLTQSLLEIFRIGKLSIANFYDVSNGTGTQSFVNQRRIETLVCR